VKKLSDWRNRNSVSHYIEAVIKSADEYAEKAEKLHIALRYIAKLNSLRWSTKDKEAELKSVRDQLEASRLQLQDLFIDGEWVGRVNSDGVNGII